MHTSRGKSVQLRRIQIPRATSFEPFSSTLFTKREGNHMKIPENAKRKRTKNSPKNGPTHGVPKISLHQPPQQQWRELFCCMINAAGSWLVVDGRYLKIKTRRPTHGTVKSNPFCLKWTQNFPACQVHENSIAAVGEAVRWRKSVTADFFTLFTLMVD